MAGVRTWDLMPEHEARRLARDLRVAELLGARRVRRLPPGFAACHAAGLPVRA